MPVSLICICFYARLVSKECWFRNKICYSVFFLVSFINSTQTCSLLKFLFFLMNFISKLVKFIQKEHKKLCHCCLFTLFQQETTFCFYMEYDLPHPWKCFSILLPDTLTRTILSS